VQALDARVFIQRLVVTLATANHKMRRILVDTRGSANILYIWAFELMGIDEDNMTSARCPLVGFTGEQVLPIYSIEFSVMAGTFPRQQIVMVKFLVVNQPS